MTFRTTPIKGEKFFADSKEDFNETEGQEIWTCEYSDETVVIGYVLGKRDKSVRSFMAGRYSFKPVAPEIIFNPIVIADEKLRAKWENLLMERDPGGYVSRLEAKLKEFGFSGEQAVV